MSEKTEDLMEVVTDEIAESFGEKIADRVIQVRGLKVKIEEKRESIGIVDDEKNLEELRGELLDLTRMYRERTGTNWTDDEGYAQYVQGGFSYRYSRKDVDEALAAILGLHGELNEIVDDKNSVVADAQALVEQGPMEYEDVVSVLAQVVVEHNRMTREARIRIEAMDHQIKAIARARHTSTVKEHVSVK